MEYANVTHSFSYSIYLHMVAICKIFLPGILIVRIVSTLTLITMCQLNFAELQLNNYAWSKLLRDFEGVSAFHVLG